MYSHDGTHIAYGVFSTDAPHATYESFGAAGFKPRKDQQKSDIRIIHNLQFEVNGQGFVYDQHAHIWVMNANGSDAHALTSGPRWSENGPAWSPDDKTIAFNSLRYVSASGGPNDVYTIAASGGAMHKLASNQPANNLIGYDNAGNLWTARGGVADPAAFPQIVRNDRAGVAHVVVAQNSVQFGDTVLADMGEPGGLCGFQFAPKDAFTVTDVDEPGYSALVKFNTADGSVTKLTDAGEAADCSMDRAGRTVAYTKSDFTHLREVYVLDLSTGQSRRLTGMNDAYLASVQLRRRGSLRSKITRGSTCRRGSCPRSGPKRMVSGRRFWIFTAVLKRSSGKRSSTSFSIGRDKVTTWCLRIRGAVWATGMRLNRR